MHLDNNRVTTYYKYINIKIKNHMSKKFVCTVCGFVYEGDEVPEDYKCPICGAGKAAFEEA